MTHARCLDAHLQFLGTGRVQLNLGDGDGPGLRVRPG
jgi:hypothetical protein